MTENAVAFGDVKNMSTEEYFNGNKFSIDAFNAKYAQKKDGKIETYVESLKRVCDYVASCEETEESRAYWSARWFDEIFSDYWHPAGSIMQGADSGKNVSLSNCTTISMGVRDDENEWDSLESIIKNTAYTVAKTAAYRQGLGVDFSRIRPKGLNVLNSSNISSGAIHWMKFIDSIGNYIGQAGRVPAMLFSINVNHPDVEEFIQVKSDYTKIQNANISVQITNDFMEAVKNNGEWELKFEVKGHSKGDRIYIDKHSIDSESAQEKDTGRWYYISKRDRQAETISRMVSAKGLLELLAKNMTANAEPGIQFIDMAKYWSNSDYVYDENAEYDTRILSTNAPFVGSTMVNTKEYGSKTIKELYELGSATLYSFKTEKIEVLASFKKYENQQVWEIVLENGSTFKCSGEHKWPSPNMVETKNLVIGDELQHLKNGEIEFVKIKSITATEDFEDMYCAYVPEGHIFFVEDDYLTSNCSEQYLSRESLCVLASVNCGAFSTENYEDSLKKIAYSVNRFLDNVNEMEYRENTYATPHQKLAIKQLRRTGAGITNIAGWLFKANLEYGSKEANEAIEKFNERYNYFLYESSINLGHEKGSFGAFSKEKYTQSPFIKMLENKGLVFDAMRNVTCSSVAPTGTLSLMFRDFVMSYGVEPAFGIYFWKRTRISGNYEYYFCVPSVVREYYKEKGFEIPMDSDTIIDTWDGSKGKVIAEFIDKHKEQLAIKFKNSTEVPVLDKLDLMSKLMKDVDSSISVTYTLPENADWKDSYDLIVNAYDKGVKSIAAFPDKKMYGIVSFIPFKELAFKLKDEGVSFFPGNFTTEEFNELNIQTPTNDQKVAGNAEKRQKTLEADLYVVTSKGKKYIMVIGVQNNRLYEMFGGLLKDQSLFKFAHKKGKITKVKQGHYSLEIGDDIAIGDFGDYFTPTEQILFRMISTSLRHGIPIKFIVEQLSKGSDDMSALSSTAARVLKKYIKDGEKVSGGKCPSCGADLIYHDGCASCGNSCGYSKCS